MGKSNNLHDFVLDIADTVRNIKGTVDLINPQDFSTDILNIAKVFSEYINGNRLTLSATDTNLITTVTAYAFNTSALTSVAFNNVTEIKNNAFDNSQSLTSISFPKLQKIGQTAFGNCPLSQTVVFPNASGLTIGSTAFRIETNKTTNIEVFDAYVSSITGNSNFKNCNKLKAFIIRPRGSALCTLNNPNAFDSTPIKDPDGDGYIYVADNLVDRYKSASNWIELASKIKGISELPED